MSTYRVYKIGLFPCLISYVLVSCTSRVLLHGGTTLELFPFFAWTLYSKVPGEKVDYGIRITALDGAPIQPPKYLEHANLGPVTTGRYGVIQQLGAAVDAGDDARMLQMKTGIESTYFREYQRVDYELIAREYDILQRFHTGAFAAETVVLQCRFANQGGTW